MVRSKVKKKQRQNQGGQDTMPPKLTPKKKPCRCRNLEQHQWTNEKPDCARHGILNLWDPQRLGCNLREVECPMARHLKNGKNVKRGLTGGKTSPEQGPPQTAKEKEKKPVEVPQNAKGAT